jgi:Phage integrase family
MTTDAIADVIDAITRGAGLDDHVTSHILRHTFGTELTRSGVDLVTVAELMGHASLETTRLYTREADLSRHAACRGHAGGRRLKRPPTRRGRDRVLPESRQVPLAFVLMDSAVATGAFTLGSVALGAVLEWARSSLAARRSGCSVCR